MSIKQEVKLSEPAVQIKKDKKGSKDLLVCPKKKKRKQHSPAKVKETQGLKPVCELENAGTDTFSQRQLKDWNKYPCLSLFFYRRFSATMTTTHWACRIPSVTSVVTAMLRSEPTTICRGTSSFTLVWITQSCFFMLRLDYFSIIEMLNPKRGL